MFRNECWLTWRLYVGSLIVLTCRDFLAELGKTFPSTFNHVSKFLCVIKLSNYGLLKKNDGTTEATCGVGVQIYNWTKQKNLQLLYDTLVRVSGRRNVLKNLYVRPIGLNCYLRIGNYTLTSCQKVSHVYANKPPLWIKNF